MIEYIRGRLVESEQGKVIIEVGGTGIQIIVPPSGEPLPAEAVGNPVTYYTRLVYKEDELVLYGFEKPLERDFFNLVIGVSGFGPRLALSMLGMLTLSQIYWAIMGENIHLLCQVPGVGKKISQRLILELRDKLPKIIPAGEIDKQALDGTLSPPEEDLTEALLGLGYSRSEAAAAMAKVHRENTGQISKEEALRLALKSLGGG